MGSGLGLGLTLGLGWGLGLGLGLGQVWVRVRFGSGWGLGRGWVWGRDHPSPSCRHRVRHLPHTFRLQLDVPRLQPYAPRQQPTLREWLVAPPSTCHTPSATPCWHQPARVVIQA